MPGPPSRHRIILVLTIGLLSISVGSLFIRFSQEAPSLTISLYRLFFATLLFLPFYRPRRVERPSLLLLSGVFLALHFACWIASLRYTSVAVSVLLVNTVPVPVALVSYFWFRERLTAAGVIGIAMTIVGGSILFWNDLTSLGDWRGPVLATLGALAYAFYLLLGKRLRSTLSLVQYVVPVYATGTVVLAIVVTVAGLPVVGFSAWTFLFLILAGLIPQGLGHTASNWALKHISATVVATLVVSEPILATLWAYLFLDEPVTATVFVGGVIVGTGICLVARWGTCDGRPFSVVR